MKISVITPTYNREYTLERCFESLESQTYSNFEWIIIDDGSSDNTERLVEKLKNNSNIDIKYLYQENQGKHIAHNLGVLNAKGELTVCVDSDDYLSNNALEKIVEYWNKYKDDKYIGIIAKRGDRNLNPICSEFPKVKSSTMYNIGHKYGVQGDTALFFRTKLLKKELFKTFTGEKFLSECSMYYMLDRYGELLILDEVLYVGEYLQDGLTQKFHKLLKDNPRGSVYCYKVYYQRSKGFYKLKYAIIYNAYKMLILEDENQLKDKDFILRITRFLGYIYMKKRLINA